MTAEQMVQLWKLVKHQPGCRLIFVNPFEAKCECCEVVLKNIFDAGVAAKREALHQKIDATTAEQQARDMLGRMGVEDAQSFSAGDLVELTNLIAERNHLISVVAFIGIAGSGGELFPVGPTDTEFAEDGNTILRYVGPWRFLDGEGDTFLAAVEDSMRQT